MSVVAVFAILLFCTAPLPVAGQAPARLVVDSDWEYSEQFERSPSRWKYIMNTSSNSLLWPICGSGTQQSPAPLSQVFVDPTLKPISNTWVTSNNFTIMNDGVRIRMVPQDVLPSFVDPNTGIITALSYAAIFVPSGHTWGGTSMDGELAFVHGGSAPNAPYAAPPTVIVTAQLVAGYGHNEKLQSLFSAIPTPPLRSSTTGNTAPPAIAVVRSVFSVDQMLPGLRRNYVTYAGSEFTPPCREGVRHYVFTEPVRISRAQLALIKSKLFISAATSFTPIVARASRLVVAPSQSNSTKSLYLKGRQFFTLANPPATEALTSDAMLSLAAVIISAVLLAVALVALGIATCYARTEESS